MFIEKQKNFIGWWLLAFFVVLIGVVSVAGYFFLKNTNPTKLLATNFVQKELIKKIGSDHAPIIADLPMWLGLTEPKTYLLLFLNNTELRPGGGFIGSYAVLRLNQGKAEVLKVEGSEALDRESDRAKLAAPPEILKKHLGVQYWYFRDSNWSPDFAESSQKTLQLYALENGVAAADIDAVIGVTTHVLEEIMKRTGPITVQGIEFKPDNVIEKLEYEVEYGFKDRGIDFRDRKNILGDLFHELVRRLGPDAVRHPADYAALVHTMATEKHILAYSPQVTEQNKFIGYEWAGLFAPTTTDYVLWVDANLAALKTDHALVRNITYTIKPEADKSLVGTVTMQYQHKGVFDWRTSRYRTFARIFVPAGAELLSVSGSMDWDRSTKSGTPTVETVGKHQSFGAFISIEPGETKTLSFVYRLAPSTVAAIAKGDYTVTIPKQLGTEAHGLTLGLDFGTTITAASPPENQEQWGNTQYTIATDLRVDRYFAVTLK